MQLASAVGPILLCLLAAGHVFGQSELLPESGPLLKEFCFNCHSDKRAKAGLNLQRISASSEFAGDFKTWEKVIEMLDHKEMPPEDEPQPSDQQRKEMTRALHDALDDFVQRTSGDPGRIVLRRLTSAEYAYSIQDLTGLDLGLERGFISDAVGGEGFSNVGDVQFMQDATLEHYLEAAKRVASHAVIGAGPLRFYNDPGKTGQELAAAERIQRIYREHGFRTAAGEGGKAYGLDRYPKAFFAAWRYRYRNELGLKQKTLDDLAREEGVAAAFVEHLVRSFEDDLPFPGSEIVSAWRRLPPPDGNDQRLGEIRAECDRLYDQLRSWQASFAENTGDAEAVPVLSETSFRPSDTNAFRIRLSWPPGTRKAVFHLAVATVANHSNADATIIWREPTLRFRQPGNAVAAGANRRARGAPLRRYISAETALGFAGESKNKIIGTNDFITTGSVQLPIAFNIPEGATQAELALQAQLVVSTEDDQVVRCTVSHELSEGATAAATGMFSVLLANPHGKNIASLKEGVAQFSRRFPQISHREATPADRDPIPAPFDNDYNNPERNEFHATLKYHRDDAFLAEHMLDSATRHELNSAWTDLLTSFDYHNIFLRFLARKYRLESTDLNIEKLTEERQQELPKESRRYVAALHHEYTAMQKALQAAEPGQVEDALHFAQRTWRRPLRDVERERLRSFYTNARAELDHPAAIRALITRILVAPAFLYRVEPITDERVSSAKPERTGRVRLSDWELASRLSYFLWSSIPDSELLRAASNGELTNPDRLAYQADRMLRDPKARRLATEFFGQWFGFYRFDEYRGVDTSRFTEFTEELKHAMYEEAIAFFEYIVRQDRPIREILFADYAFLNRGLASHYGIPQGDLPPNSLVRVEEVSELRRGGLLRLGAVLTSTSAPLRTSAVKRGDWILRRVLGRAVPPPPGDAGSIPPDDVLDDGKTVRQRLEAHRRDATCANCHSRIDALGFALEHFDSLGRWRNTYRDGQRIDPSGTLNDGAHISGFEGLNDYLRANETLFHRALCGKLLGFALGRAELVSDRPLLDEMVAGLERDGRFSTLVTEIVRSPQFRYRRADN